jgi:putative radical SAM enzyme (TIGR03279 family)
VVVCPGINDGEHLTRTLLDLAQFHRGDLPAVASVAVVPVGLTRFRPVEDELIPVVPEKAREVIEQVRSLQTQFRQQFGSTFAWLADEWFLIAGEDLPAEADYEDYPQIGNGVGSIRQFLKAFHKAAKALPPKLNAPRRYTWIVGNAVEQAFQPILERLNQVQGLEVQMRAIASTYWGQDISVTGLITGQDILQALQGQDLGDAILLPTVMLKHDDPRFLDDLTVDELATRLNITILPINGVEELIEVVQGEKKGSGF